MLTAITDDDSSALTTALAALPADYDAAWKAEAEDLRRKRAAVTAAATGDGPLAHAAAEGILGLSRAGVRAMARSWTPIVDHIRGSDALSTAERTALTAVLTGDSSGLTTALTALTGATYTTAWKNTVRQHAATYNAGDIQVDITGGSITAEGNGVEALYTVPHDSNGDIAVTVSAGARVTGGAKGIYVRGAGVTAGARNQAVTVHGAAMGGTGAGVHVVGGGAVTVGASGEVGTVGTAPSGIGILGDGGGDLTATVSGTVTGDIRVNGGGDLAATVKDGGTVTGDLRVGGSGALTATVEAGGAVEGTIRDPQASFTVSGRVGRVLYASGGTVTVAGGAKLTGVGGVAAESTAGLLTVTVNDEGRVEGDIKSGGTLMATVNDGGVVTGTIEDPQASFTVGSGASIGRILYASGGTVTVSGGGKLTGVEGVAVESTASALTVTVNDEGRVEGDVKSGGTLSATVNAGGVVTGTIEDPQASFTVGSGASIGRLLYASGGRVTVSGGAKLTGVEGVAVESTASALTVTVNDEGRVEGDVKSGGTLMATVNAGGVVTGTVHLAASTVRVDGTAGRVRFDNGGTVTVGTTGSLTGIEVDDRTEAIRNAAGDLVVSVAGKATGDIIGLGDRPARVTTEPGSRVAGSVEVAGAGSDVRVGGAVDGRIRFRRGGMVTVGPDGRIEGKVSSDRGELVAVVERKPEETEADAVERAFPAGEPVVDEGGTSTLLTRKEGEPPCPVPCPLGTEEADAPVYEARMRVYEALPSVVLGLNGLPGFRERMAAPRSAQGGWARVEALRGKWKAEASTSGKESGVGLEHRHRRHGVAVGWAGALGEEALVGVSLHHRRGSAEVSEGGDLELSGTGAGVSGTWMREEAYVDVQAEMTGYEADLTSSRRGVLKKDVSGHGHALGVEAGRRLALERLPAGVVLTPRAGLVHSRVSVDAFSDAVGARVTVDGARSLKGRVGVEAEVTLGGAPGSRVFGSVEVEHEFSTGRKVRVSGRELKSEADATWLRLGLDGAHTWEEGRYTLQGGVGYATSGGSYEFGGGVSLRVQF